MFAPCLKCGDMCKVWCLQGNILDDEELINTLSQSKATSNTISAKVAEAEATEKQIDATRELYRPVAARASLLFFCISDLATIDPMYQYSLSWFSALFVRAMVDAPKSDDVAERGATLNDWFTFTLYVNVCRSLFERHKLTLSFLLAVAILKAAGHVDGAEWRFLLAGPTRTEFDDKPNPAPAWLTDKCWVEVLNVAALPAFAGFDEHFARNIDVYKVCPSLFSPLQAPTRNRTNCHCLPRQPAPVLTVLVVFMWVQQLCRAYLTATQRMSCLSRSPSTAGSPHSRSCCSCAASGPTR